MDDTLRREVLKTVFQDSPHFSNNFVIEKCNVVVRDLVM